MSMNPEWYVAQNGQSIGPISIDELIARLPSLGGAQAMVYGPGVSEWVPAGTVDEIVTRLGGPVPPLPPAPGVTPIPSSASDEIDYEIHGEEMQFVEVVLDPGEMVIGEPGVMMFMTSGIQMDTRFGDPNKQNQGVMDKLLTAGKRAITGESLFVTTFKCAGSGRETIAFAAPYPGKLLPMHLDQLGGELICQKDSFICAARGTQISVAFQKRIGVGLFGGEGFIMQRLTGDGIAIIHAGGNMMQKDLAPGELLKIDTGCLVAMQSSVDYDVQFVGGIKNTLFGGEGLFFATLRGPGRIWLQSLPFSRFVGRIKGTLGSGQGGGKGEGSVLGVLGGMLGGD